jgi:3-hydroxybutyrate dehydrogenase
MSENMMSLAAQSDDQISGKVALVTGSVDGIGHACLRSLAAAGCSLMMHGLGNPSEAESKRAALQKEMGVPVHYHAADLSDAAQVQSLFNETVDKLGPIDILVNNAVTRNFHSIESLPIDRWSYALAVNLTAPFRLTQLTLPSMKQQHWGRIINIASNWGLTGTVNRVDYVASKHALIGLTRATALEAAPFNITCNAVCPGATLTPDARRRINERMAETGQTWDEATKAFLSNRGPSGRFIQPEQVASLIFYLCSPGASEMTGTPVVMDGGWRAM